MTNVAIVTGGSRGIGRATALKLGAQGYTVVVNYASNEAAANEVVKAITQKAARPSPSRATWRRRQTSSPSSPPPQSSGP